jgi:hypothetical protein
MLSKVTGVLDQVSYGIGYASSANGKQVGGYAQVIMLESQMCGLHLRGYCTVLTLRKCRYVSSCYSEIGANCFAGRSY